jgi:hypothetical protein
MPRMLRSLVLRVSIVGLRHQPPELSRRFQRGNHVHHVHHVRHVRHRIQLPVLHRFKVMNKKLGIDEMVWDLKKF